MDLNEFLKKKTNITESTKKQYISMLRVLNNNKDPNNLNYLKSVKKINELLKDKTDNTKKSYYAVIVSVLKISDPIEYKTALKTYIKLMNEYNKKSNEEQKKNEMTGKQKENWMTLAEIDKVYNKLEKDVKKFTSLDWNKKKTYRTLLDYTILSLYLLNPPRRNMDYCDMNLVLVESMKDLPNTQNYYNPFTSEFIFNKYKTVKKFGQQRVKIPIKLKNVLTNFILHHPMLCKFNKDTDEQKVKEKQAIPLFVQSNGNKITSFYITKALNRIFGKKIGVSMLRHIVLSEKFGKLLKQQKELAQDMAHSMKMQTAYIKYDDNKINHKKIIEI
jgi:hypothetical protein